MKTKYLFLGGIVVLGIIAGILSGGSASADTASCPNPPSVATFNPYPIDFSGTQNCTDLPLIAGKLSNGTYPQNQSDFNRGVFAKAGDEISVRVYIHNGAATNLDPAQTTAKNVKLIVTVPDMVGEGRTLAATVIGGGAETINGTLRITTNTDERVVVVPGSAKIYTRTDDLLGNGFFESTTVNTLTLGDMKACYEYLRVVIFKVRVEKVQTISATPSSTPSPSST